MTTTTTETLEQEYNRLFGERDDLASARRTSGAPLEGEAKQRLEAILSRLQHIVATPPEGYTLPKPAADLVAFAAAHGWSTGVQWTPPGWADEVHVNIRVGRKLTEAEREAGGYLSDGWLYEITYHERGCPPGKVRRFGSGLTVTPDCRALDVGPAPSLKTIRAVISAHPSNSLF